MRTWMSVGVGSGYLHLISAVARLPVVWEYNRAPVCTYVVRSKLEPLLECTALYSGCTVANHHEVAMKSPLFSLAMHVVHNPQRNTSTVLYNNAVQQYCISVYNGARFTASPSGEAGTLD